MSQEFRTTDVVRLEVQQGWPDLPNLILNPSGESGAWGWYQYDPLYAVSGNSSGLNVHSTDHDGSYAVGTLWEQDITPGSSWYIRVALDLVSQSVPAGTKVQMAVGSTETLVGVYDLSAGVNDTGPVLLPDDIKRLMVVIYVQPTGPGGVVDFTFRDAVLLHGPQADVAASDPLSEPSWTNILGSSADITTERDELQAEVLNATIYDSTLDPATDDLIRPGKRCRLSALVDSQWERLFTGTLDAPSTVYNVRDPLLPDGKRTQVKLRASGPASTLANTPRANGVGTIPELPAVLLGAGVPWNVNGSTDAIDPTSVTVVSVNDSASALDQVAITRDSVLGYAWIDRTGTLQAWGADQITTTPVIALDEADYSDLGLDFELDRLINSVKVNHVRINPGTGETEEVEFGPYESPSSIREWSRRQAEFRVQGVDDTQLAAYAEAILTANANPSRRINTVTLPLRTIAEVEAKALLDLYDLVTVSNTRGNITGQQSRITSVKHTIQVTPRDGSRWTLEVGFASDGSVAVPQVTPSPTVSATKTLAELLRPVGEVTSFFCLKAQIPAGWLPLDGSTFDPDAYPKLAAHFDSLGLPYLLPDATDRALIGAGSKALGQIGGSPTTVINSANLPPHTHGMNHTHGLNVRNNSSAGSNPDRVMASGGVQNPDNSTAVQAYIGQTSDGSFPNNPLDVMNPWLALWVCIRAA